MEGRITATWGSCDAISVVTNNDKHFILVQYRASHSLVFDSSSKWEHEYDW
jgi:hypothetical protein